MRESTTTAFWCVVIQRRRAVVVSSPASQQASQTLTHLAAWEYPRLSLFSIGESLTTAAAAQRGGCRFSSCWPRILPIVSLGQPNRFPPFEVLPATRIPFALEPLT